jgi:hypothetical protein
MVAEIGAAKTDTEIGGGGPQRKKYSVAGVKTDSVTGDLTTKCALYVHQPLKHAAEEHSDVSKEGARKRPIDSILLSI